jgi:hypothetical protein
VGVQSAEVVYANVVLKLLTSLPALFEEVRPKPNLLQVRLVRVLGQDLLDSHLSLGRSMHSQPDQAEPSSAQQPNPLEILGEAFSKLGKLICRQVGLHIECTFLAVLIVKLDGLFLLVLALAGRGALLNALGVLLLLPIK